MTPELKHKHHRYMKHRRSAKWRGIAFLFTFEEWVEWWGEDWEKRGNGPNDLVMARVGDTGPYHPSNVRKLTMAENSREGQIGIEWSEERRKKQADIARTQWLDWVEKGGKPQRDSSGRYTKKKEN